MSTAQYREGGLPCLRCGVPGPDPGMQPLSCSHCPPVQCATCGEPNDRECSCWEPATQAHLDELTCASLESSL